MTILALQAGPWWCPMCRAGGAWGWTMMGFMMLFWVLVIAGIVWALYRGGAGRWDGWTAGPRQTPEEILRERYARGEIDRETYRRMLDDLRGTSSTGAP